MSRIEKTWEDLDTSKVDFSENSGWGWGCGGAPLYDWEYFISYTEFSTRYEDGFEETRYKLPECLNLMLRQRERQGRAEAQADMRVALGLNR